MSVYHQEVLWLSKMHSGRVRRSVRHLTGTNRNLQLCTLGLLYRYHYLWSPVPHESTKGLNQKASAMDFVHSKTAEQHFSAVLLNNSHSLHRRSVIILWDTYVVPFDVYQTRHNKETAPVVVLSAGF